MTLSTSERNSTEAIDAIKSAFEKQVHGLQKNNATLVKSELYQKSSPIYPFYS